MHWPCTACHLKWPVRTDHDKSRSDFPCSAAPSSSSLAKVAARSSGRPDLAGATVTRPVASHANAAHLVDAGLFGILAMAMAACADRQAFATQVYPRWTGIAGAAGCIHAVRHLDWATRRGAVIHHPVVHQAAGKRNAGGKTPAADSDAVHGHELFPDWPVFTRHGLLACRGHLQYCRHGPFAGRWRLERYQCVAAVTLSVWAWPATGDVAVRVFSTPGSSVMVITQPGGCGENRAF